MTALALPTIANTALTAAAFALGGLVGWLIWLAVRDMA
jgi:hypothetical protein